MPAALSGLAPPGPRAVSDVGELACGRLDGSEPAFTEVGAPAGGRLCAQRGYVDVGAFQDPGLDHRQEVLYLLRPCARGFKEI
ncbi:hypothetical protein ACWCRC_42335 [Streptomyces sp. NPDC001940]|uniref:hypothetical protein n=1 Tax=Streptomyces TaxID=1883 RepID=UPI001D0AC88E|nr:hypothetical protein [Streptomyces longhuiensis]UDL96980.1 hypothetical protein LGI35_01075 [Streptomyces longhuiensis]